MEQSAYYRSYFAGKGIHGLRNAFLLYLIGGILTFVPAVSGVGGIVDFIGLIFLIIAFRDLGRSNLNESKKYESAGKWLIRALIIVIVLSIAAVAVITAFAISSLFSELPTSNLTSSSAVQNSVSAAKFGQSLVVQIFVAILLIYTIWLAAWVKMSFSIKTLSRDLERPKLLSAGNMYATEAILGYGNFASILLSFSSGFPLGATNVPASSFLVLAPYSDFFLGGIWIAVTVVALASSAILIYGSYTGYRSLGDLPAQPYNLPPRFPPPPPSYPSLSKNYCRHCGAKIDNPEAVTCPKCYQNV